MAKSQVITAKILVDPGPEAVDRTLGYVLASLKSSLRNIRDGSVMIALYNEEGQLLGLDVSGSPSEEIQSQLDDIYKEVGEHRQ